MRVEKTNGKLELPNATSDFEVVYHTYADELLMYGSAFGFDRETLKDAIQDVFLKLYLKKDQLQQIENMKYYLFRALKNRLLDIHRSSTPTLEIEAYDLDFVLSPSVTDELISKENQAIIEQKIGHLLSLLTNRQREAIFLRFTKELSYDHIAQLLEMTPQAVRKLVFRGMERMRKHPFFK